MKKSTGCASRKQFNRKSKFTFCTLTCDLPVCACYQPTQYSATARFLPFSAMQYQALELRVPPVVAASETLLFRELRRVTALLSECVMKCVCYRWMLCAKRFCDLLPTESQMTSKKLSGIVNLQLIYKACSFYRLRMLPLSSAERAPPGYSSLYR